MSICEKFNVYCQCLDCRHEDYVCTEDPCNCCDGPVQDCDPGQTLEEE